MNYTTKYTYLRFQLLDLADKYSGKEAFSYWYGHYERLKTCVLKRIPMANQKMEEILRQARERTAKLLEEAKTRASLPSALDLQKDKDFVLVQTDTPGNLMTETRTLVTKVDGTQFDPYDIPGVGRANKEQSAAILAFGIIGKSGCLIGPAGTGKTTTMRAIIRAMIMSGRIPILSEGFAHKYLKGGLPGIYGGAFTRIATRNLRNNVPGEIQDNICTHHRLLEFEPESFTVTDPATNKQKVVRVFKPTRHSFRTLPIELCVFLFDETSMLGLRLHQQIIDAIHPNAKPQFLYIGDIAQIPPVMDDAILGYKMLEHLKTDTCIELKEVYRHAGAIVNLANHIRVGNTIPDNRTVVPYLGNLRKLPKKLISEHFKKEGYTEERENQWSLEEDGSKVTVMHWKNRLDGDVGQLRALQNLGIYDQKTGQKGFFIKEMEAMNYNPMTDMILMPYNKAVGTIEMNKYLANYLARERKSPVFEIIAGRNKHYFAVGDKIFFEREEAIITKININAMYAGRAAKKESVTLDRWGHDTVGSAEAANTGVDFDDVEALLNIDIGGDDEERKNQASHVIYIKKDRRHRR
jgi:ABC-type oligopeptide transport system ATPase subunit